MIVLKFFLMMQYKNTADNLCSNYPCINVKEYVGVFVPNKRSYSVFIRGKSHTELLEFHVKEKGLLELQGNPL